MKWQEHPAVPFVQEANVMTFQAISRVKPRKLESLWHHQAFPVATIYVWASPCSLGSTLQSPRKNICRLLTKAPTVFSDFFAAKCTAIKKLPIPTEKGLKRGCTVATSTLQNTCPREEEGDSSLVGLLLPPPKSTAWPTPLHSVDHIRAHCLP